MVSILPPRAVCMPAAGQVDGRYRLLEQLGEGGFSIVWQAEPLQPSSTLPSRVALKQAKQMRGSRWPQVMRAAFTREAAMLASLSCPWIPRLFEACLLGERPYLVMEEIAGPSLSSLLQRQRIPTGIALAWGYVLSQIMADLHRRSVIYRDLKPENILLRPSGCPLVLVDFGLALPTGSQTDHDAGGDVLSDFGTEDYASPEQCEGRPATALSDVYSLALVLLYLLTGSDPAASRPTPVDALALQTLPGLTLELVTLLAQMLSENPDNRPTMEDVATRFGRCFHPLETRALPASNEHVWKPSG